MLSIGAQRKVQGKRIFEARVMLVEGFVLVRCSRVTRCNTR